MIRINLDPQRKRKKSRAKGAVTATSSTEMVAAIILGAMVVGWGAIAYGTYYLYGQEVTETARLKGDVTRVQGEAKAIAAEIKDEELQAIKDRVEQITRALEKVQSSARNPVYVMREVANILTPGLEPDKDPEEYARRRADDPEAKLNPQWDGTSVWLSQIIELENGGLEIVGGARDASDLSEFVKRLRASARFDDVSNPEYTEQVTPATKGRAGLTYITFKLKLQVRYWD